MKLIRMTMRLKKQANGKYCLERKSPGSGENRTKSLWRDWWLVGYYHKKSNNGLITLGRNVCIPTELVGKRIRLVVEEIE